jgi:hypothetical protein
MTATDPVEAVLLAFLDHLDGTAARPDLEHLSARDRHRAQELMDGLVAARGIEPYRTRPSLEALLADTPLAGLVLPPPLEPPILGVTTPTTAPGPRTDAQPGLVTVAGLLADVDRRARADLDAPSATVVYSYLDLRARFLLVEADTPAVTGSVRAAVAALFRRDADTSRVGLVAARSAELLTQVLSPDDVSDAITTPNGDRADRFEPVLPLALAARRMLEQAAPEWPSFDVDQAHPEPLDLTAIALDAARRIIEREAARSFRGDKRRAYRSLVGQENVIAELVTRVSTRTGPLDLDAETERIARAAA